MSEKKTDDKQSDKASAKKDDASAKGLDNAVEVMQPQPIKHGEAEISLPVYLKQADIKPDQSAGFEFFAHAQGIESNTVAAWHKLHDTFNKRPV